LIGYVTGAPVLRRGSLACRRNRMTVTDVTVDPASTRAASLAAELKALRKRAGRICDQMAALYRRMDELQRQIDAHQQR
jgi:hypothetical protein